MYSAHTSIVEAAFKYTVTGLRVNWRLISRRFKKKKKCSCWNESTGFACRRWVLANGKDGDAIDHCQVYKSVTVSSS